MSQAVPSSDNMVNDIPAELLDLQKVIDTLPPAQRVTVLPAFQRVVESTNRRRKILQLVQESIGQLRLDMKYLVFDLEATRRERDLYQKQLEELNGDGYTSEDEGTPDENQD
ncbi:transcriptional regulator [Pirellulaceae bacterium SH449]